MRERGWRLAALGVRVPPSPLKAPPRYSPVALRGFRMSGVRRGKLGTPVRAWRYEKLRDRQMSSGGGDDILHELELQELQLTSRRPSSPLSAGGLGRTLEVRGGGEPHGEEDRSAPRLQSSVQEHRSAAGDLTEARQCHPGLEHEEVVSSGPQEEPASQERAGLGKFPIECGSWSGS